MQPSDQLESRRPLKVRGNQFSKNIAKWLSQKSITPNQISVLSIVFAIFSAICFVLSVQQIEYRAAWMIAAALFIQARLLCNLFDGMVAIEGGKSTASGELFNDIPDRISDPIIIIAAGYSILAVTWGVELGGLAALLDIEAHHSENRISNSHIQWYMRIRKAERLISGFILPRFLER